MKKPVDIEKVLNSLPKKQSVLPAEYEKIYFNHYLENRNGKTKITRISHMLESWGHNRVARSSGEELTTLEIGAGTLNQLNYENTKIYDIVEPFTDLYRNSKNLSRVRNTYSDIEEINDKRYERIIAVYSFEHIGNLPEVIEKCRQLLNSKNRVLCAAVPNEGRLLWKLAYRCSTAIEFKRRYGLDYEVIMQHEHLNTADEIAAILNYYFSSVLEARFGIGKDFSLYRYFECRNI